MKKRNKFSKIIRMLIAIIAIALIAYSSFNLYKIWNEDRIHNQETDHLKDIVYNDDLKGDDEKPLTIEERIALLQTENSDFIGWLSFESKLLELPVVYSGDNSYYLNKSFYKKNSDLGTAFLDKDQSLASDNMTIYGHYVYRDESLMFSPLHKLKEKDNYSANKYFSLYTDTGERKFEVAYVYYSSIYDDVPYYMNGDLTSDTNLNNFVNESSSKSFYNTGVTVNRDDRFVTLQTCVRNRDDLRLIVVGREINK